ncbi:hypothetical protein C7271_11235 [filamentous cyanobacterium CCP5]|nr:hypothetical protein C7271_11235 [filamentous cyanobacterium CCP5]
MATDQPQTGTPKPVKKLRYQVRSPDVPLAVYREVVAHLRQVDGVEAGLLPQTAQAFAYTQSQTGGLWLQYPADQSERCQAQIEAVLTYYGQRYRPWENLKSQA